MEARIQEQSNNHHATAQSQFIGQIQAASHAVYGITLLQGVLKPEAGQAVLHLLKQLTTIPADPAVLAHAYSDALQKLAEAVYTDDLPGISDAWQAYLVARIIDDSNLWSTQIERGGTARVSPALRSQAQRDLRALQYLFKLNAQPLWELTHSLVTPDMPALRDAWIPWLDLQSQDDINKQTARRQLAHQFIESSDWAEMITPLERYWARYGTGRLARYHVLRWQDTTRQLEGIAHPDVVHLTSLIGHERQQPRVMTNIERFIAGLPAHDMLLYGPPGTGKSSTIKAIANAYAEQGLCLVEVSKEHIKALPQVVATLRGRARRYLLFIDDLSFEEHETGYKTLKVLLEGTAEARPHNMLICATSNRMNLVRESFSDRGKPTEDVNWRDTMDEKQSLVHRFGLRISFMLPDQEQYLRIVTELARQRNLDIDTETLHARALQWERQHAGRSGRSARQFIDDLEADLKLGIARNQ